MRYENRQPPEGINVTQVNPVVQFLKLMLGATLCVVLIVVLLQFFGGALARQIPFEYEKKLTDKMGLALGSEEASPQMQAYLNDLAQRVSPGLDLPAGMDVTVHYSEDAVFNAFATVGGNLLFYKGLLEKMPHENALAMVMAHEIAHIKHRDPVSGLGGGVASMVALSMITGSSGVADQFLNQAYLVTGTQFTRDMENDADVAAVKAVNQLYGHVNGAGELFEVMGRVMSDNEQVPDWLEQFLRTHPLNKNRIDVINSIAQQNNWNESGELSPLPEMFNDWLNAK